MTTNNYAADQLFTLLKPVMDKLISKQSGTYGLWNTWCWGVRDDHTNTVVVSGQNPTHVKIEFLAVIESVGSVIDQRKEKQWYITLWVENTKKRFTFGRLDNFPELLTGTNDLTAVVPYYVDASSAPLISHRIQMSTPWSESVE